ncbi:MAG TPA: ABC transporter permease subunit [Gemmatimonas sp.]|nr:ABC transporter permease subunit [Gemmatimonas sp.]
MQRDAMASGRVVAPWHVFLLVALGVVSLGPVLLLVLRAAAASWLYPDLLPSRGATGSTLGAFATPILWSALTRSVLLAVATAVVATLLGFVAGRGLVRAPRGLRELATGAAFLPVVAPPIALGVGIQVLAIRAGVGGSLVGVLIAHVIPAAGYLTLYFLGVLSAYDRSMEDEARTLGATAWQTFLRVTVPALRARWLEALVLGALVSWGQLALTLLVGGGAVQTLPVALLSFTRAGDDRLAAAAALLLTIPPALAFGVVQRGARRTGASA